MAKTTESMPKNYLFRDLDSNILIGMAMKSFYHGKGQAVPSRSAISAMDSPRGLPSIALMIRAPRLIDHPTFLSPSSKWEAWISKPGKRFVGEDWNWVNHSKYD
jgi:hypothetical protein